MEVGIGQHDSIPIDINGVLSNSVFRPKWKEKGIETDQNRKQEQETDREENRDRRKEKREARKFTDKSADLLI